MSFHRIVGSDMRERRSDVAGAFARRAAVLAAVGFFALSAAADHGPGTSGGGLSTQSGETMRPGAVVLSLRSDFTQYEDLSDDDLQTRTLKPGGADGHFDALDWSLLETIGVAWGLAEDVEVGASLGFYDGEGLREGHLDAGVYDLHKHGSVKGVTDPWLTGKVRVYRGPAGRFAVLGGLKPPLGTHTLRGEGERLDPAVQPGSGAFDAMAGVACSEWLTERTTLDASFQYTVRGRHAGMKIGNRAELGTAVAYRFSEAVDAVPRWSAFLEATIRNLQRNNEGGEDEEHSGGTAVFIAPGVRTSLAGGVSVSLAIPVSVLQRVHEDQQETRYKVSIGVTKTF